MRSEFYMNGFDSYIVRDGENPHAPGTAAWEDWEDGFRDAQAEEESYVEVPDEDEFLPDDEEWIDYAAEAAYERSLGLY